MQVVLIENKEESLLRAQSRSSELGLKNIGFIQANLDYFTGPFHIGVSREQTTSLFLLSFSDAITISISQVEIINRSVVRK